MRRIHIKKKQWLAILIGSICIGGSLFYARNHIIQETTSKIAAETAAKENLKKEILRYLSEEHTSQEIETKLLDAFTKLDPYSCTELVDTYLYGVYNTCAQYVLNDEDTNLLYRYVVSDNQFDFSELEDEDMKKTIKERADQHIVLRYLNGALYWDTDYAYFDQTFAPYVIPDYRDIIHFYAEEREESYFDDTSDKLYTNIVIQRLNKLQHLLSDLCNRRNETGLSYRYRHRI